MTGRILGLAAAAALVVLQTSAGRGAGALGVHADLLLLVVLAAGMRGGGAAGAVWGVGLGFLQDTFSAGLPGAGVLTKGLLGYGAGSLRERLDCGNPNTQALVAAGATLADGLAHLALLTVFSEGQGFLVPLLGTVVPAAAANGALLPFGLAARRALARRLGRLRRRRPAAA